MKEELIVLFVFIGTVVVALAIIIPLLIIHKKYKDFALLHSLAIAKKLCANLRS